MRAHVSTRHLAPVNGGDGQQHVRRARPSGARRPRRTHVQQAERRAAHRARGAPGQPAGRRARGARRPPATHARAAPEDTACHEQNTVVTGLVYGCYFKKRSLGSDRELNPAAHQFKTRQLIK